LRRERRSKTSTLPTPGSRSATGFLGSPTIRVDGRDVDPSYRDPADYTPRCRVYWTAAGLRGLPERAWVESALQASLENARGSR
jgi:hypothetical protein